MKKTVVYSLLFGTMLLGATVPAEAATVVFDSEQIPIQKNQFDQSIQRILMDLIQVPLGHFPSIMPQVWILGVMRYRIRIKRILPERKPIKTQMVQQVNWQLLIMYK